MGRILAVDPGTKRIGLALTDPGKTFALPLETIPFTSMTRLAERLAHICGEKGVELVIVGFPIREDGYEGEGCRRSRVLAAKLAALGIANRLWDESWSSRDAEEIVRSTGKKPRGGKKNVDAVAASLILRDFLESNPSAATHREASSPKAP